MEGSITKKYRISEEEAENNINEIQNKAFRECFEELQRELNEELEMGYTFSFRFNTDWYGVGENEIIYTKTLKYMCLK